MPDKSQLKTMEQISEILNKKEHGIDCTEDESAMLKDLIKKIADLFPSETAEALNEINF